MAPLVSILIPAYNSQDWIAETIKSALAQTWATKEIVIVDDGSSDRTLEIARQFASASTKVVTQANQGAAAARNTAYSLCQGDYIQWLDADDVLAPDKVEKQVLTLNDGTTKRTLLSGAWAYFIYRQRKARFTPTPLWARPDTPGVAAAQDGAESAHADRQLARQPGVDGSCRALGRQVMARQRWRILLSRDSRQRRHSIRSATPDPTTVPRDSSR